MKSVETLLKQRQLFNSYLACSPSQLSTHSFIYVFIWQDFFNFEFKIIENCLCIFAKDQAGVFMYLPPLGKSVSVQCIQRCFGYMREVNKASRLSRIENVNQGMLKNFDSKQYEHVFKSNEYCYQRQDLADLKGNSYKSKRASYNQAVKNYDLKFVQYKTNMAKDCLSLYDGWAQDRLVKYKDEMFRFMIEDNRKVHQLALKYFKELNLIGRVVELDKKIIGYTFGYELTPDCFCVLFETTDLKVKGLPAYIFKEFCSDSVLQKYQWINAMDDYNQPDLQKTKMSYRPKQLIPAYMIQERDNGKV